MMDLTDFEKDQLREIVSIGAGNAATALSKMIGKSVKLSVPEVFMQSWEKIPESVGNREEVVTAVLFQIQGDLEALMMLVIPQNSVLNLLSALLATKRDEVSLQNKLEQSALTEMGNILSGSALTALSGFLKMKMLESVPEIVTDMLGSIMISVLSEMGSTSSRLLVFQSTMFIEKEDISGQLLFIFNSEDSQKILLATSQHLTHG